MTEIEIAILDVLQIEKERVITEQEKLRLEQEQIQAEFNYVFNLEDTINRQKETISYLILNLKEEKQRKKEKKNQKDSIVYKNEALAKEELKIIQSITKRPYKFVIGLLSTLIIVLGILLWNSHFNKRYEVIVFAQAIQGCTQALEEKTEEIKDSIEDIEDIKEKQDQYLDRIKYLEKYRGMVKKTY